MKRLLFVVAGLLVCLNLAYANDLLFKASNGALNQNSVGVKKLTDKEMAQVKGGFYFQAKDYGTAYYNAYGQIIYSLNWFIVLESDEIRNVRLYINGNETGNQAYHNYTSLAGYARGGAVAVQVRYNVSTGAMKTDFAMISSSNRYSYSADKFAKSIIASAERLGVKDRTKRIAQMLFQ